MARGWESKAVEDQIGSAEADKTARPKVASSQSAREKQARRDSLLLSRAEIVNRLKTARNDRYRAQLEMALEHLEGKLRELERDS
ncbi:MAG: hypothetical protein EHM23_06435 [Acidobacteria bacterium]|nr:MAG: hypothetical protein EHM23_06435 [Acidobacteriota bacterium]